MIILLLVLTLTVKPCLTDGVNEKIELIKSFIENERKPTHLMFELCWESRIEMELIKEMSKIGVRSSRSLQSSKHLDNGLLFLIDLECPNIEDIVLRARMRYLFKSPYRWLVFANSSTLHDNIMDSIPILTDSDLVLVEEVDDGFRMIELYKVAPQSSLLSSIRGYYIDGSLFDLRPQRALFRRRRDLRGLTLTMAVAVQDSNSTHQHYEDRLEPQHDFISKVSWLTVRLGIEMLNATSRLVWAYRFGYVVNGSWSGMVADMIAGKADVGTNLMMTGQRMDVVSFTDDLAPFRVRFIFRQPPLSYVANIFRLPFSTGVWIALVVCTIASSIGVWAATYWEASLARRTT